MTKTQYVGKAGHLAAMAEFAFRGYNVATPEIDVGDDIFVVNDETGAMWRLQIKTATGKEQKKSRSYQFRVRGTAIQTPQSPELHFVFVMRWQKHWRFMLMSRDVVKAYNLGTLNKDHRQINITLKYDEDDKTVICAKPELTKHLADWDTWPMKM